jgi:hypothetical protein
VTEDLPELARVLVAHVLVSPGAQSCGPTG